jgi:hypothetical protein
MVLRGIMAHEIPREARADHIMLATHCRRLLRPEKANKASKTYAVGLEISCPGGAYYWAPKIPSSGTVTGAMVSKCELVHNRAHSFCAGSASLPASCGNVLVAIG